MLAPLVEVLFFAAQHLFPQVENRVCCVRIFHMNYGMVGNIYTWSADGRM
jgi:hypothetical protein